MHLLEKGAGKPTPIEHVRNRWLFGARPIAGTPVVTTVTGGQGRHIRRHLKDGGLTPKCAEGGVRLNSLTQSRYPTLSRSTSSQQCGARGLATRKPWSAKSALPGLRRSATGFGSGCTNWLLLPIGPTGLGSRASSALTPPSAFSTSSGWLFEHVRWSSQAAVQRTRPKSPSRRKRHPMAEPWTED